MTTSDLTLARVKTKRGFLPKRPRWWWGALARALYLLGLFCMFLFGLDSSLDAFGMVFASCAFREEWWLVMWKPPEGEPWPLRRPLTPAVLWWWTVGTGLAFIVAFVIWLISRAVA